MSDQTQPAEQATKPTEQSKSSADSVAISPEQVVEYLQEHPEFLLDSPGVLEMIQIPYTGGGTSLLEHQASVLRDKNRSLESKLRELHDVARDNEARLQRLHDLYLDMLHAVSLDDLLGTVLGRLREEFGCDQAMVVMFGKVPTEHPAVMSAGNNAHLFDDLRESREAFCGRLNSNRRAVLFGDESKSAKSVALAPLDDMVELGLLALGSTDEDKFHPGMGTLFLTLLGQMLGQAMLPLLAEG